ncbi:MAG: 30S ribosomal protein S4e [Nanoarchaeota archaeon]|nr:30S ribosomal protein S4e [Nanoarchaeota archaeon]
MVKQHLKRIAMPNTWQIKRKGIMFITRPKPGSHKMADGLSLNALLKHVLGVTATTKEVKAVANAKDVLVDGVPRKDHRYITGLFDVVAFPKTKKHFRIILNKYAKIDAIEIDEKDAGLKPCKLMKKTLLKGNKIQLNLSDGRNMIIGKNDYKVGDTLLISLPKQEIKDHFPLEKKSCIFLIGGKNAGAVGIVSTIEDRNIRMITSDKTEIETLKKYAFVIGKGKPAVKVQ